MMNPRAKAKFLNSILTLVVEFAVSIITVYITNKFRGYYYRKKITNGHLKINKPRVDGDRRSRLRSGQRRL